jgi:hypothetical protein
LAQGFPSAQRGGGGQAEPPPAGAGAHPRAAPTATQTGASGAKQQAPLKPLTVFVQSCKVAPGYPAQAVVAVSQVGAAGHVVPPPAELPPHAEAVAIAKQIGALGAKQQEAV